MSLNSLKWHSLFLFARAKFEFSILGFEQCDQIGQFLIVLGENFSYRSSPNVWLIFGLLWKQPFLCVNCCGHFLGNLWNFLGFFTLQYLVTLVLRLSSYIKHSIKLRRAQTDAWRNMNNIRGTNERLICYNQTGPFLHIVDPGGLKQCFFCFKASSDELCKMQWTLWCVKCSEIEKSLS